MWEILHFRRDKPILFMPLLCESKKTPNPIQYSNRRQKQNKFHAQYTNDRSHSQETEGYFVLGFCNTAEILLGLAKSIV